MRIKLTSDLEVHGAVHGQGQRQEVEGVETSADVSACLALHLGLELTVEKIHHNGAVPSQVVLPRLWQCTHKHRQRDEFTTGSCCLQQRAAVAQEVERVLFSSKDRQFSFRFLCSTCPWTRHLTPNCSQCLCHWCVDD